MAEGRIGELPRKPPTSKEELGGGPWGIIGEVSTKILPLHSTLHLQVITRELERRVMITNGNQVRGLPKMKKGRASSDPAFAKEWLKSPSVNDQKNTVKHNKDIKDINGHNN